MLSNSFYSRGMYLLSTLMHPVSYSTALFDFRFVMIVSYFVESFKILLEHIGLNHRSPLYRTKLFLFCLS